MALGPQFNLKKILSDAGLDEKYIKNAESLNEEDLKTIFDDFVKAKEELLNLYKTEFESMITNVKGVHSISGRIKDPEHLITKIIRNTNDRPDKYKDITTDNYYKLITDLVGFRIIVLNKKDWRIVHNALKKLYNNDEKKYITKPEEYLEKYTTDEGVPAYYAEKPKVYVTAADAKEDIEEYEKEGIEVDQSRNNYRSLHYIVKKGKFYFEIQVRSLFEEGWLEFGHRVLYPNDNDNQQKKEYVQILNSLAKAADGLISFYDRYKDVLDKKQKKTAAKKSDKEEPQADSKTDYVNQLDLN